MVDVVEPDQSYHDEVDGNDVVQQRGHYQNQNAGDKGDERRDVGGEPFQVSKSGWTTAPAGATTDKAAAKQKKAEDAKMKKQRTADCTKQAKEQKMTGAARTKFMKDCTSKM